MNADFLDLLTALNAAEARFLVVGGYAVGVHGRPRATKLLDVWIEASGENARRVMQALREFGAPLGDLAERDLETPGTGFKMGEPPTRIDILQGSQLSNIDPTLVNVEVDGTTILQDPLNGWTYDNPKTPTQIILHGAACATAQTALRVNVSIVLGCATQTK